MRTIVSLLIVGSVLLAIGCSLGFRSARNDFETYALSLEPVVDPNTGGIPRPQRLPEEVYKAACSLSATNRACFERAVVLVLLRYHRFYIEHYHQSYAFVASPLVKDMWFSGPTSPGASGDTNDNLVLARWFCSFSGWRPNPKEGGPYSSIVYEQAVSHFRGWRPIDEEIRRIEKLR